MWSQWKRCLVVVFVESVASRLTSIAVIRGNRFKYNLFPVFGINKFNELLCNDRIICYNLDDVKKKLEKNF